MISHHFFQHMSKKKFTHLVDKLMMAVAVVHPLSALPQVYDIFNTQNASGVSLATWVGFMVLGVIMLTYAILHKIKPLIVTQVLWFIVDALVVIGVLMYS